MCWSPNTIKSTTISSNSNIDEIKHTKSSISQTISQKPPKVASTSQYEINEYNPSPIDFTEIDNSLLQRISSMGYSEQDKKYALAAKHVSEYAKRFSDIQDMLIASPKTLDKLDSFLKEIEILKMQIADDSALNWDETGKTTPDSQAAMAYAEEVETIVRHYRDRIDNLENIDNQLFHEDVDIRVVENKIGKLKNSIAKDKELQREGGAYAQSLYQKIGQVEERVKIIKNKLNELEDIYNELIEEDVNLEKKGTELERIKKDIGGNKELQRGEGTYVQTLYQKVKQVEKRLEAVKIYMGFKRDILEIREDIKDKPYSSVFTLKTSLEGLEDEILNNSFLAGENEILGSRLQNLIKETKDLLNKKIEIDKKLRDILKDSVLGELYTGNKLSYEAQNALKIFMDEGLLQNEAFFRRLNDFIEKGHRHFYEKEYKQLIIEKEGQTFKDIANSFLPPIAEGKIDYIDFLLLGEHLDDLALEAKLRLNKKVPEDLIILKHELSIAKREFAKLLRKKEKGEETGFASSFYDVSFDEMFVEAVTKENFNYKNINLVLAKACILQAKVDKLIYKQEESLYRKKLEEILSKIGLEQDIKEIERFIEQKFKSYEDVRKVISSLSQFAIELQKEEEIWSVLFKGLSEISLRSKAEEVISRIVKNFLELDSSDALAFEKYQSFIKERYFSEYIKKAQEYSNLKLKVQNLFQKIPESLRILDELKPPITKRERKSRLKCCEAVKKFFTALEDGASADDIITLLEDMSNYSPNNLTKPRRSSTRKGLKEIIREIKEQRNRLDDSIVINLIKSKVVPYLEKLNTRKKAEAYSIYIDKPKEEREKLKNIIKELEKTKKELRKVNTKTRKLITSGLKDLIDVCILKDIVESKVQDIASYTPDIDRIKELGRNFGFLIEEVSEDDFRFVGMDHTFKSLVEEYKNKHRLDGLLKEVKLNKARTEAERKIVKETDKEVLFGDKVSRLFYSLEDGQKLILSFGKNINVNLDSVSTSGIDVGLQFNVAKENSISIFREEDNFIFLLKGGKKVGGTVEVGTLVDVLSVGVGIEAGKAKGVKVVFDDREKAEGFLKFLLFSSSHENVPIKDVKEFLFIKEVSLDGKIEAGISINKGIGEQETDVKVFGDIELKRTISLEENFDVQIKREERTISTSLGIGVGVSVGDKSIEVSKTKESSYKVIMEEMRCKGRLIPSSSFTKTYNSVKEILELESKGIVKIEDNVKETLKEMESDIQEVQLRWRLKDDVCFIINEKEISNEQEEAKALLENLDSYYPSEVQLVFTKKLSSYKDSRNLKYFMLEHEVNFGSEKKITFEIKQ